MTQTTAPDAARYSFNNDDPEAADRHDHLAEVLDGFTQARISSTGELKGMRCLEVGAGGGSVARWLAEQVGPDGRVLATDLNTCHLSEEDGYEIMAHNLVTDPVPEGPWDIIHARLVLLHIPERVEILRKLAASLAPGGALVLEDWATEYPKFVLSAPDAASAALIETYHAILTGTILPSNGNDPTWAGKAHGVMRDAGLRDVNTEVHARSWPGGSAGALLMIANVAQVRDRFLVEGFTEEDIERLYALARDPSLVIRGHFTYSTIGRKPGATS